jgi:cell wall-associated NlpC family hydrolase
MHPYRPARSSGGASLWLLAIAAFLLGPHLGPALAATFPLDPSAAARPSRPHRDGRAADKAVAFALAQRGKVYRGGAEGPTAYDCSGLTWAAWQAGGVEIPRTAAGQLEGLPPVRGELEPGDLVVYSSSGPSRRHVAMVVGKGRMVEAPARGVPVRVTGLRSGWLGAVRPGSG